MKLIRSVPLYALLIGFLCAVFAPASAANKLPQTGGVSTTALYTMVSILVLAAGTLLVVCRRMA